jgi:predicted ATPase
MKLRIGFTGASGTGKSTLAEFVAETYGLPINPVGSRSVAAAMGYASPYDVDAAGNRALFHRRLVDEKVAWEEAHESFVTDRATIDNLTYTVLHDVRSLDAEAVRKHLMAMGRYTHIFHCPQEVFCKPGDDTARVNDSTYHWIYDATLLSFLLVATPHIAPGAEVRHLQSSNLEERKQFLTEILRGNQQDNLP